MRELCVCAHSAVFDSATLCSLPGSSVQGFFRQEYWTGLLCSLPGGLPYPGIKLASLMSPRLAGGFFGTSATWEALFHLELL